MKLTIDVMSTTKEMKDVFTKNIEVQTKAIEEAENQTDKFALLGTLNILLKLSVTLEKKLNGTP